jgi:cargo-transport protein YPP1
LCDIGLITTANTELKVVQSSSSANNLRPPTARPQNPELSRLIPPLLSTIEGQGHPVEDVFQAQTCLAWIHWLLSEPGLAASSVPKNISLAISEISRGQSPPTDCTMLCILKAVYMKASYRGQEGDVLGSIEIFRSIEQWIHQHESTLLSQPQLQLWSEQLLAHTALTASDGLDVNSRDSDVRIDAALQAFRQWAIFSAKSQESIRNEFGVARPIRQKVDIWKAYYLFLSKLLQNGIDQHALGEKHNRLHQAAELRRVETTYETELLRVTRFPKANESNQIIEEWVEQVIRNWEVLCGTSWPDAELGEGGRQAVGRNVLDILYRAATKTFHSTLILQRLFEVHKSLTDFELAYKALDSYLELITRGKARPEKSHQLATGIDGDQTVLRTVAEGIEGLCSFGRKDEAEKAIKLTTKLETWTKDYTSRHSSAPTNGFTEAEAQDDAGQFQADGNTLEIAYRATAIGKAFWGKWTPMSERRSAYYNDALANLNRAATTTSDIPLSLDTAYAQALLLAETRDIKKAVECVKRALSVSANPETGQNYSLQRKTIPMWHLLALLLSARQDFSAAYQMCDAAFDQFDADILFGTQERLASGNANANADEKVVDDEVRGLVDDMNDRELERLIEIKMTELALVEIVEGVDEAVNGSDDLLSLFSRLFGQLGVGRDELVKPKLSLPPKSSAGTVKSFRGSIFGRKRHEPRTSTKTDGMNGVTSIPDQNLARYSTQTTEAPTIQVTDENSRAVKPKSRSVRRSHSHHRSDSESHRLHKREGSKTSIIHRHSKNAAARPMSSHVSSRRQSFETGRERLSRSASTVGVGQSGISQRESIDQIGPTDPNNAMTADPRPMSSINKVPEAKTSIPPIAHNVDHKRMPPPPGHEEQPPQQDVRLPIVHPETTSTQPPPRFPRAASQINAYGILVKIWLLIASLYRRALLYEDSKEACDEAARSASRIEALVAAQYSSAAAFADRGWGGGKGSNEIWADVHAEKGYLALAKGMSHEALKHFEEALTYFLDHPRATVGLSNILLDIYEQKVPLEGPRPGLEIEVPDKPQSFQRPKATLDGSTEKDGSSHARAADELRKTPENLNRLAARDRAYGLLSNLTKLGSSWDDSDAWFALARAHECGGQIEKAKEVLWWCVELEDRRPVRHWRNIGPGSYVL